MKPVPSKVIAYNDQVLPKKGPHIVFRVRYEHDRPLLVSSVWSCNDSDWQVTTLDTDRIPEPVRAGVMRIAAFFAILALERLSERFPKPFSGLDNSVIDKLTRYAMNARNCAPGFSAEVARLRCFFCSDEQLTAIRAKRKAHFRVHHPFFDQFYWVQKGESVSVYRRYPRQLYTAGLAKVLIFREEQLPEAALDRLKASWKLPYGEMTGPHELKQLVECFNMRVTERRAPETTLETSAGKELPGIPSNAHSPVESLSKSPLADTAANTSTELRSEASTSDVVLPALSERTRASLGDILAASVYSLVIDQHSDPLNEEYNGAWGRSTADYVFLATRRYPWSSNMGSVTQTAWALLGLNAALKNEHLPPQLQVAIRTAQQRGASYVGKEFHRPRKKEDRKPALRHDTATILAFEFLHPEDRDPILEASLPAMLQLLVRIESELRTLTPEELGGDLAQVALYVQLLPSLVSNHAWAKTADVQSILASIDASALRLCGTLLKRGLCLGTWGNEKVLSPMLQSAMLLSSARLARDASLMGPLFKDIVLPHAQSIIQWCSDFGVAERPQLTSIGAVDPWTALAFAIAALSIGPVFSERERTVLKSVLERSADQWRCVDASLTASTIQWSVILKGLSPVIHWRNDAEKEKCCDVFRDPHFGRVCHQRRLILDGTVKSDDACRIWKEKFQCKAVKMEPGLVPPRHFAFLNRMRAAIGVGDWVDKDFIDHVRLMYGEMSVILDPDILRVHVLLAGFSTAGKSTVGRRLCECGMPGVILPRVTTRIVEATHEERAFFIPVALDEFKRRRDAGELVAPHDLWDNWYAFRKSDIGSEGKVLIYQVGWSEEAIHALQKTLVKEPVQLFVLNPGLEELERRLATKRKHTKRRLAEDMAAAEVFYGGLDRLGDECTVINTAEPEAESLHQVLKVLEPYWQMSD